MSAAGWESAITVAELVHGGPLGEAVLLGPRDGGGEVRDVRIADRLEVLASITPHTAVVLTGAAAEGGWAVEMALRRAWEQAAACVVAPAAAVSADSTGSLAVRLGVPLLVVSEDPLITAVRIATAAARPAAARTQLVARCAQELARAGTSARRVVGVLNAELAGASVALVDAAGTVLAGSRAGLAGPPLAEVAVPGPGGEELARLRAAGPPRSPGWPAVVAAVLELAVAPLTAWAARARLAAAREAAFGSALLDRLLRDPGDEGALRDAAALGWAVHGPLVAYVLRPVPPLAPEDLARHTPGVAASFDRPLVRHEDGWAGWCPPDPGLDAALRALPGRLPAPCSAGLSGVADGVAGLGGALADARAASVVAGSAGTLVRADEVGPAQLLAALPVDTLAAPARAVLAPLLAADRDGVLIATLAAVLDTGSPTAAAERLGVHRNTVAARLDRVRALGFDLEEPAQRLALHLACRVLREERGQ
ncbi:PucR family transcriptional regulator [Bailinhaonella thermotolerans]|uniref:PucR family transcriptional regulator n=1 Tax=Bailinhaonella thermotolerans TaxID=1070861 RepID=A0A3A4ATI4_9ACTN|nr:helix-turn-helix domain-containing protein [Bailinhaonella thermotolerans]RJL24718.1 PucR family transcriptional regulator [Bailinhaonella thermotolerans]